MPFAMSHLCIALNILNRSVEISNPSNFMLGCLAPDSIHFRPDYKSYMKKITHLCVGDEKWGEISNNSEWIENIMSLHAKYKGSEYRDFAFGYCAHILSDISWNKLYWIPYRLAHANEIWTNGSAMHRDCNEFDLKLFENCKDIKDIWTYLDNAKAIDLPDLVTSEEIDKMRMHLMNMRYQERKSDPSYMGEQVTFNNILDFIDSEPDKVLETMNHT
jgi:hypothetical protein